MKVNDVRKPEPDLIPSTHFTEIKVKRCDAYRGISGGRLVLREEGGVSTITITTANGYEIMLYGDDWIQLKKAVEDKLNES